ncbi:ABC transporter permease [Pseudonocardia dioxanivorans]|uniref:ABC transporter permease n=1 Tax=Pseudonocardia dioxanivorans TaxID=240495 RepID=UPI000CD0D17D|nr:iron ABC transporter permease [Pseudonocardia dioxanivorans]
MLAAGAAVAVIAALPLVYLVVRVGQAGGDRVVAVLIRPRTWELAANTVLLVAAVCLGCLVLGVTTAVLVVRIRLPAPGLWWVLASLPLAIPSYITAFAWLAAWPGLNGFWPVVGVMVLACTPYVTIPVLAALRLADAGPEDVARTLGRGPVAAFATVTLPQVLPAALAGSLLVALYTLSDFGAIALLRYQALTWAVHASYTGTLDRVTAAVLALVLTAFALAMVLAERRVRRRATAGRAVVATRRADPVSLGRWATAATATGLAAVAALSLLLPPAVLASRILRAGTAPDWVDLARSAVTTLALGAAAAALVVVLAVPVGVLAARYRGRSVGVVESLAYLGHGLPGIVVGLALVFLSLGLLPALYQTAPVLVFAYAVLFLPKAVGATRAAVERVPTSVEEVSRTLGRSALGTWFAVTGRQAWPGIAAGGLLVAVTTMKELPATLMLRPIGLDTLATDLWQHTSMGAYGAAAPAALLLVLVASVPAWFLSERGRRR